MHQLYFLSVLCNGLAGYILIMGDNREDDSIEKSLRFSIHNGTFRMALGIISAVIGILKLLSPITGNMAVLGDLLPAAAGIIAGFVLIFGYYREHTSAVFESEGKLDRLGDTFLKYKRGLGAGFLAVAALHFLFPQALFL